MNDNIFERNEKSPEEIELMEFAGEQGKKMAEVTIAPFMGVIAERDAEIAALKAKAAKFEAMYETQRAENKRKTPLYAQALIDISKLKAIAARLAEELGYIINPDAYNPPADSSPEQALAAYDKLLKGEPRE